MLRLVKNIALFALVLLALNALVHRYFLPYGWGDNVLYMKHKYYTDHKDDFNAIYLGGSLIYRHIDPVVMDSVAGEYGLEFNSYNYGVDGNGYLKMKTTLEEILKEPSPELKYVFTSLSNSAIFLRLNMHTKKFVSWWTWKDIAHAIRLTWQLDMPAKRKAKFTYFYLVTLVENRLNFGLMTDAIQFHIKKDGSYDESFLGMNADGFYPYHYQAQRQLMSQAWEDSLMKVSRITYLTDTVRREAMLQENIRQFQETDPGSKAIDLMVKTYQDMIDQCAEKGIKLIVVMPPRIRESYEVFIPTFERLPEANRISLASPLEYPEFYDVNYSYNFHHLDLNGAHLYSKALAEEFLNLEGIDNDVYDFIYDPTAAVPMAEPGE